MYGQGTSVPQVLGAATGITAATVLPQTGMSSAIQVAIALAVGLAVWAVTYMATSKFPKR